ncbi:MAG: ABC-2 transporter permease [Oscillospiraceae bacterium]|nr:ABC-2 transporter permease [Oscillospiraceae bacterium]
MRGFLRRDLSLLRPGAWFYPVVMGVVFVGSRFFSWMGATDITVYLLLAFGMESLYSLMTYDSMNGWLSYAAAVPGGRGRMVDVRYLLAICAALALAGLLLMYFLLREEGLFLWAAGFYVSAFLFTLSVTLPVGFHWGYGGRTMGRLAVSVITFVMLGVLAGVFYGVMESAREDLARGALRADVGGFFTALAWELPLLGLGILALSWRISRQIMEKKEF